ncbi:zinc finger protein Xfin-like isoform X2 [Neocloeon triangulifer]|uniref:zinc finger protein Xfin-like isoform X2 n=1 Tax=Neocloeon triangulifer TaxID=2078957 RepID=UPI00286F96A2|nr:zinc finger protein Xfin-like isoform X2 [Neocloeon triangulifer]
MEYFLDANDGLALAVLPGIDESNKNDSTEEKASTNLTDLTLLCRMCARQCVENPDLGAVFLTKELAEKLKAFLDIEIEGDSEHLPKQLCQECSFALERWAEIREMVKRSKTFYQNQLELRGVEVAKTPLKVQEVSLHCAKCNSLFSDFASLVVHELTHLPKSPKKMRKDLINSSDESAEDDDDVDYEPTVSTSSISGCKRRVSARNSTVARQSLTCGHCEKNFDQAQAFFTHLGSLSPSLTVPCTVCNCKFNLADQLVEHTKQHQRTGRQVEVFPCGSCSVGPFASKSALQQHSEKWHRQAKLPKSAFPCGLCSLGFDEFVDYSKHVQTHVNFRHFPCALCGCKFTKVPYLLDHIKQHSAGDSRQITFMCEICPDQQVFSSKHNLASHMTKKHRMPAKVRPPPKTFEPSNFFPFGQESAGDLELECGLCSEVLNSCQMLSEHVERQHKKFKHIVCKKCQCKFTKLPYYLEHVAEHVAHPDKVMAIGCEACDEIFSSKHNLSKHIYKKHRNTYAKLSAQRHNNDDQNQVKEVAASDEEPKFEVERNPKTRLFHCKNCPETFKSATLLNTHFLEHVPNKCPTCHGLFETREQLKEHLTQKCRQEEKFPCPICGKLLATKQSMRIHTSLHSSERKFVCEVCAKTYRTQSALVSHRNVVHLQKSQFMCHICARTFSFKLAMKRHVMLHMGDLPHKCMACDKAFVTANLLKIHVAKEHERRVQHFCTSCKKGFVDIIGLRRHMRAVCKVPEHAIPYIRDRQFVKHSMHQ